MRYFLAIAICLSVCALRAQQSTVGSKVEIQVTPNRASATYGVQEALNQVPAGGPQWGTNVGGALIQLAGGDYYFTNCAFYSNTFPTGLRIVGSAILATRWIYAGLGTTTNLLRICGGGNPNGGLDLPLNVELENITFTSLTNMQAPLVVITNSSFEQVRNCNFTSWELVTNNLHGASLSIDGPAPTQPPGNVGLVIGASLDHATIVENCFFAGLACGIDIQGDHFYGTGLKSAYIGQYGAGPSDGTAWANTSPYSLGPFILRRAGLSTDVAGIHCYQVNTAFIQEGTSGVMTFTGVQWETVSHGICEFNAGGSTVTWIINNGGLLTDDGGGPFTVTHAPYALSASSVVDVRYPIFSKMLTGTGLNGNGNSATNFNQINSDTMTATNGYWMPSNAIASWPATPRRAGDCFWGNSNGVIYQLVSKAGSLTWSKTNLIGTAP